MPVQIRVPAKINLWLEVIRKRDDGYHDLSSLMLPIGVFDHVELDACSSGIALSCDHPEVPEDSRNLAWKAAELYLARTGLESGVRIRLKKAIPVAAGLGGGSADAAAVLLGMNRLFGGGVPLDALHDMGRMLGADVPFFIHQQPALATGIGENLQKAEGLPEYPLVLIKPSLTVSTRWVYQRIKLTRGASRIKIAAFLAHPWRLGEVMQNDLEAVTIQEYPLLADIKKWLVEQGAVGALMSGSGPTIFGIFPERSHAERVGMLAEERWGSYWVTATQVQQAPASEELTSSSDWGVAKR